MRKSGYLVTREIEPLILPRIKLKISGFFSSPTRTLALREVYASLHPLNIEIQFTDLPSREAEHNKAVVKVANAEKWITMVFAN